MNEHGKDIIAALLLGLLIGFVLGTLVGGWVQPVKAYEWQQRVCLSNPAAVDPCITRQLAGSESQEMAHKINAAVGREWRGLR